MNHFYYPQSHCIGHNPYIFLDFIKSLPIIEKHSQKVNSTFSILVGVILGITYGAGILIAEYKKGLLQN